MLESCPARVVGSTATRSPHIIFWPRGDIKTEKKDLTREGNELSSSQADVYTCKV